ncbi:unnamed protein product [Ceratitis capitata]|uniref:(Mediterranean fruit fly) hypothetical protein n=1 Tax=Ceratitis capitata TaxID=7213 RepID=A0A811VAR2_CERCA|nr:unnamed protein product [Ceratitis capitata]
MRALAKSPPHGQWHGMRVARAPKPPITNARTRTTNNIGRNSLENGGRNNKQQGCLEARITQSLNSLKGENNESYSVQPPPPVGNVQTQLLNTRSEMDGGCWLLVDDSGSSD